MSQLVSVVVPFYNEAQNAPLLAAKLTEVFQSLEAYQFECVFVNDGSTDGTREALNALARADARFRPLHFTRNFGQSAALIAGMREAKGEYIITLDGDLQNDPIDIPKIIALLQDYDCVCGYRAERRDSWLRRASSKTANAVRNAILHDGVRDSGCGAKGFRRCCIAHFPAFNGVHRFFAVMVRNAGLTIAECPVTHHERRHGASKYGLNNRLWRGLYDLVGVAWFKRRYVAYKFEEDA